MDNSEYVRAAVASNEIAPKSVLIFLGRDDHYYVRMMVAANQKTPKDKKRLKMF